MLSKIGCFFTGNLFIKKKTSTNIKPLPPFIIISIANRNQAQ
uniref:Uncharacterized protein n=1 Tax=Tetranychus urticae TaxID=32264 RepID=T1K626_TETUR